jgi:hypothetical protein
MKDCENAWMNSVLLTRGGNPLNTISKLESSDIPRKVLRREIVERIVFMKCGRDSKFSLGDYEIGCPLLSFYPLTLKVGFPLNALRR